MNQKNPDKDLNLKIIKEQGGTRYDPMHPDHLRYRMENGGNADRFVAAVEFHTLSYGHPSEGYGDRSPWAVDEHGKVMKLKHFAEYFGWHIENARKVKEEACASGRVREDEHGRFWLRGRVKVEHVKDADPNPEPADDLPAYIRDGLAKLTPERRADILSRYRVGREYFSRVKADAIARARRAQQEFEQKLFKEVDIEIKTCEPNPGKNGGRAASVELALSDVPDTIIRFVQNGTSDHVQGQNRTVYKVGQESTLVPAITATSRNGKEIALSERERERGKGLYVCKDLDLGFNETDKPTNSPPLSSSELKQAQVKAYLREYIRTIGRTPTTEEIQNVWLALGSASIEQLQTRVDTRRGQGYKIQGYGFFVRIAEDCAGSYKEWENTPLPKPATPATDKNARAVAQMIERRLKEKGKSS